MSRILFGIICLLAVNAFGDKGVSLSITNIKYMKPQYSEADVEKWIQHKLNSRNSQIAKEIKEIKGLDTCILKMRLFISNSKVDSILVVGSSPDNAVAHTIINEITNIDFKNSYGISYFAFETSIYDKAIIKNGVSINQVGLFAFIVLVVTLFIDGMLYRAM